MAQIESLKDIGNFGLVVISKVSLFMLLASWGLCVIFDDDNIFRSTKHQSRIYCFDESNPLCVGNVMLVSDNAVYLMVFFFFGVHLFRIFCFK